MRSTSSPCPLADWPRTRVSELLGLRHPIVQGPFGGGLSTVALAAAVADAGGLGSFGAHQLSPDEIVALGGELRATTARPFAINLWVATHDLPEAEMTRGRFDAAARPPHPP
jgi:nitronate monooxygenase